MSNARDRSDQLLQLLRREHAAMADFLLALADFDQRRLWVDLGHSSLFYFLTRELGLSAGAAQYRKTAAELIQRFPDIAEPLRDGRLCLSSVIELAKVITYENQADVLPKFFHLSRREAAAVAVTIRPVEAAPQREMVTPARAPAALARSQRDVALPGPDARPSIETESQSLRPAEIPLESAPAARPATPPAPQQRDSAEPLTAELSRLHMTLSRRVLEKIDAAKDALSHARPGASTEEVLEEALDLLLAREAKERGQVKKPRPARPSSNPDYIPASVKREVWRRDGGQCQWKLESGGVCGKRRHLEFDHVVPRARGGVSTVGNIRLTCKFHNLLAARQAFGDEWMDRYTSGHSHNGTTSRRRERAELSGSWSDTRLVRVPGAEPCSRKCDE